MNYTLTLSVLIYKGVLPYSYFVNISADYVEGG